MKIKTQYIGVKIEPALKKEVERRAKQKRVPLSQWIRYAIELTISTENGRTSVTR